MMQSNGVYTSVVFNTTGGGFVESKAVFNKFIGTSLHQVDT